MGQKSAIITGVAGELGSGLAQILLDQGYTVHGIDQTREHEAWRLEDVVDDIDYIWKDTVDIQEEDIEDPSAVELVVDCGAISDRPFGTNSPRATTRNNLEAPLSLIETFKEYRPVFVYPASGVEMLGVPVDEQPMSEDTPPLPVNVYGWSKYAAEELYQMYGRAQDLPVVITRSASVYGEGMRTNQAIAQFILMALRGEDIDVRSPDATRTPQYVGDVKGFYEALFDTLETSPSTVTGRTLISGGNAEDTDYSVLEMAETVVDVAGADVEVRPVEQYESGEKIGDEHVTQHIRPEKTRDMIDWEPEYTFREGLERTIEWFRNTDRYRT